MKAVLIPSTFTSDEKNLYLRNYKIGELARACSAFSVDEIYVYWDKDPLFDSHGLGRYITKILDYCNTPPYLRKHLFPKEEDLKYVGVIPPLKSPHQIPEESGLKHRMGYVLGVRGKEATVDCGYKKPLTVKNKNLKKGQTVTIDEDTKEVVGGEVDSYNGYQVEYFNKSLVHLVKKLKRENYSLIGTSRKGKDIRNVKLDVKNKVAIAFGSPYRGLSKLLGKDMKLLNETVNVVPGQKVETVRTEEAVYYTLSILRS